MAGSAFLGAGGFSAGNPATKYQRPGYSGTLPPVPAPGGYLTPTSLPGQIKKP
jgi:hypothetical protein